MALRIAFDLDGVLADMESELLRQAELLFGKAASGPPREPLTATGAADTHGGIEDDAPEPAADAVPPARLILAPRQQPRLWKHVGRIENFWETLEECEPGAIRALADAATERRWEIIFLTKRPQSAGACAQLQTQRWLQSKGFGLPSVFVVKGSRGRIAAALHLDVVVDDTPENCLDVIVDSKARPILVWRHGAAPVPAATARLGIAVVRTISECLDLLTGFDGSSQEPSDHDDDSMPSPGAGEPANR